MVREKPVETPCSIALDAGLLVGPTLLHIVAVGGAKSVQLPEKRLNGGNAHNVIGSSHHGVDRSECQTVGRSSRGISSTRHPCRKEVRIGREEAPCTSATHRTTQKIDTVCRHMTTVDIGQQQQSHGIAHPGRIPVAALRTLRHEHYRAGWLSGKIARYAVHTRFGELSRVVASAAGAAMQVEHQPRTSVRHRTNPGRLPRERLAGKGGRMGFKRI